MNCPIPLPDGSDCWGTPSTTSPFDICRDHWRAIVQAAQGVNATTSRCPGCNMLTVVLGECIHPDHEHMTQRRADAARRADEQRATRSSQRPLVYYLEWAGRIKIGTTTNLRSRLTGIYHDRLLAVEPGDVEVERTRHRQFAEHLVPGQREWFHSHPALQAHIHAVRRQHRPAEGYR